MTGRQQILRPMRRQNPKAIAFATKGLNADAFADIPDANAAIFTIALVSLVRHNLT
jgi:hypothetical protein